VRYLAILLAEIVMIRSAVFIFWQCPLGIAPIRIRNELNVGAAAYGILLGCLGTGALIGAWVLPRIRRKFSNDLLTSGAALLFGAATAALALLYSFPLLCVAMLLGGFAWLAILSTFNVAAIISAPEWVKSRALGVYMLIFNGGLALGSAAWGDLANRASLRTALLISAAGLAVGIVAAARYSLNHIEKANFDPSMHWPDPLVIHEIAHEAGPVVVTIEYQIDPAKAGEFARTRSARAAAGRRADWHLLGRFQSHTACRVFHGVMAGTFAPARAVTLADKELGIMNSFPRVPHACHIFRDRPQAIHYAKQTSMKTKPTRREFLMAGSAAAMGVTLGGCVMTTTNKKSADLILHNGRITTLDPKYPEAKNVAIKDGRIIGVDDAESYERGPSTRVIDLKGRRVIPGLNRLAYACHPWRA
jgi:hypothetical protein